MISMQHLGPSYSAGALLRVDQPNGDVDRDPGGAALGFSSKHWSEELLKLPNIGVRMVIYINWCGVVFSFSFPTTTWSWSYLESKGIHDGPELQVLTDPQYEVLLLLSLLFPGWSRKAYPTFFRGSCLVTSVEVISGTLLTTSFASISAPPSLRRIRSDRVTR